MFRSNRTNLIELHGQTWKKKLNSLENFAPSSNFVATQIYLFYTNTHIPLRKIEICWNLDYPYVPGDYFVRLKLFNNFEELWKFFCLARNLYWIRLSSNVLILSIKIAMQCILDWPNFKNVVDIFVARSISQHLAAMCVVPSILAHWPWTKFEICTIYTL